MDSNNHRTNYECINCFGIRAVYDAKGTPWIGGAGHIKCYSRRMPEIAPQEIVNNLTSLLRARYVFPDIGGRLATLINEKLTSNQYADIESEKSLAASTRM